MYKDTHTYTYIHIYTHIHIYLHMYIHISTYIHYTHIHIYGRLVVWLCGCVVVWLCGCLVVCFFDYLVAWLPGCLVAWLIACLVVWLCGCLVVWLCRCLFFWLFVTRLAAARKLTAVWKICDPLASLGQTKNEFPESTAWRRIALLSCGGITNRLKYFHVIAAKICPSLRLQVTFAGDMAE